MDRRGLLKATGTALGVLGGAQLIGAQSAQAAATGPVVNVRDCGAVGDGSTDDTAAFQKAFGTGAGVTVLIPPGVYPLSKGMPLPAGTTVSAYGARIVRNAAECSALLHNVNKEAQYPGYSGPGRITVLGGTWDMAGAVYTRQTDAMAFAHAQDVLIQDCTIVNVPSAHAIELNAVRGVRVVDCVFDGLDTTVAPDKEAVQITGATSAANLAAPPYDLTPCADVLISGCTLRATATAGYNNFGALCGDHGGAAGMLHRGVRVVDNRIEAATAEAIRVSDWKQAVIQGNIIESARNAGIDVRSRSTTQNALSSILIQGNTIDGTGNPDCVSGGITVSGKAGALVTGLVISGNVLSGTQGEHGVYVGYAPQAVVTGNSIVGTTRNKNASNCQAIQLDNSPNSVLTDNTASGVAGDGMFVNFSDGTLMSGNRITGCATHGIAASSNDLAVRDNMLSGLNTDGAANQYGIRIGNNAKNVSLQGNVVRRSGGATDATAAVGVMAGSNGTWITNNDLRGWGTAAIVDQGAGTATTTGNLS